jgi:hypothetical protein
MRNHIRREAANMAATWWLVPVVFATAALVAVATAESEAPTAMPAAQTEQAAPAPALLQPAAQPGHEAVEVTEHVQAF